MYILASFERKFITALTRPKFDVWPNRRSWLHLGDWPALIQTSYFIGPYNLHYLLFLEIGALLCTGRPNPRKIRRLA